MGSVSTFEPALLIIGVLSVHPSGEQELTRDLTRRYGPVALMSARWTFDWTSYYEREMGSGIERFFLLFSKPVDPQDLPGIKLHTNELEEHWEREDRRRRFNLDPGLLTPYQLVLATTKNRAQRIALSQGIYGEVTLLYQKGSYQPLPWTYPDYRSTVYRNFFLEARRSALSLLK